jgi:DNA-binding FadR family transcriptional regulator
MQGIPRSEAPQNLTKLAYEGIKTYILRENLDEETRLTEEFLFKQLGISKSPVREVLNSLCTEGLLRIEPRRSAYLRRFSRKEVLAMPLQPSRGAGSLRGERGGVDGPVASRDAQECAENRKTSESSRQAGAH